jgi:hypothetical protein
MFVHVLPHRPPDAEHLDVRLGRGVRAARAFVREAVCAVAGHDYLVQAARHRLFLRCVDCGHETPGWRIDVRVTGTVRSDPGWKR